MIARLAIAFALAGCWLNKEPAPAPAPLVLGSPRSAESSDVLALHGEERKTFGKERHTHGRICVQDHARIGVDGETEIVLTGKEATVIGGRGIGPSGDGPVTIKIVVRQAPEIFVLFDNKRASVNVVFDAPDSTVNIGITGKTGLNVDGKVGTAAYNAGWGLPASFPTCDAGP